MCNQQSAQELGKLLVLLHRNTSASSLAALMKKFDLNQNNKMDFAEFVLLMQSLPETDEAIVERAISAQGASHSTHSKSIEVHSALASVNTQVPLLSISVSQSTVVAGAQCGLIYIWDLEASTSLHRHHTTSSHHVITPRHHTTLSFLPQASGRLPESHRRSWSGAANARCIRQSCAICFRIIRGHHLLVECDFPCTHLQLSATGPRILSCVVEKFALCGRRKF